MKYEVKVYEVYSTTITVEAESEQDAQGIAEEILSAGCYPDNTDIPEVTYDYTMDRSDWSVYEVH
jgi:hypothetical protein